MTQSKAILMALFIVGVAGALACSPPGSGGAATGTTPPLADSELTAFISKIQAVDNHSHPNSVDPADSEVDALPLENLPEFSFPARLRSDNPEWLVAYRALYEHPQSDPGQARPDELPRTVERVHREQGDKFPEWVLDRVGTEVMLANRVAMGPGLVSPRFRWVSFVDALILPLSTKDEAAATPDLMVLYPSEQQLLHRYLSDLQMERLPPTLEAYLRTVVTPTLERQRRSGCVAVKFEAALLRPLDFDPVPAETASRVYSRYVGGGVPPPAEYKSLQDYLFRYIAREAGRLGLAVHIHSFEGPGGFYRVAGSDPLLLESVFNDPTLRGTNFVIVHGGGVYSSHAGAMLWKPNVYLDTSAMALIYTPATLAGVLRDWLLLHPEKVLFGTDAASFGPELGWEVAAGMGTSTVRQALAIALTGMVSNGEVSRARAEEIATMVMRSNAGKLYNLPLE